jgi:hypothetical protein
MNVKPEEMEPERQPVNEPVSVTNEQLADLLPTDAAAEQAKGGVIGKGTVVFTGLEAHGGASDSASSVTTRRME